MKPKNISLLDYMKKYHNYKLHPYQKELTKILEEGKFERIIVTPPRKSIFSGVVGSFPKGIDFNSKEFIKATDSVVKINEDAILKLSLITAAKNDYETLKTLGKLQEFYYKKQLDSTPFNILHKLILHIRKEYYRKNLPCNYLFLDRYLYGGLIRDYLLSHHITTYDERNHLRYQGLNVYLYSNTMDIINTIRNLLSKDKETTGFIIIKGEQKHE